MSKILVIAPHPDDETLGCGGSLYRHQNEGDELNWLICTDISKEFGWSKSKVESRKIELKKVAASYQFKNVHNLRIPTTRVETVPISDLTTALGEFVKKVTPKIIYIPFINDAHTDHQVIGNAIQSLIKWFRYPSVKKVLMYETLSETDFNFLGGKAFRPNVFIDISEYLNTKIETMKIYKSELGVHPFPRSEKSVLALATLRGSQSGYESAEAFELVMERH